MWTRLTFKPVGEASIKRHVVPAALEAAILRDLLSRPPRTPRSHVKRVALTWVFLDTPGMIIADRPIARFEFNEIRFEIPCEDVGVIADEMDKLPVRLAGRTRYVKLHVRFDAVVMTPEFRDAAVKRLRACRTVAWERARAHLASWQRRHRKAAPPARYQQLGLGSASAA